MDTISVTGADLSSLALGQAHAGSTPLVMLHGLINGNMASWYSSFATPLSRDRQVLLYDQRGHGGSSVPVSGFDLDTQALDLLAVLGHYGYGDTPVDVVGHSMGALVALHFALHHPQRVKRLVLVDAPMPARDHVGPSLRAVTSPEALAAYVDGVMPHTGGGRRRERLLRRLEALFFRSTLMRDVLAMDGESDAALGTLEVPVLLVYGRQSPCLGAGHHLERVLADATLRLLDCGHYIPEEAPAALLAAIDAFLPSPLPLQPRPIEAFA